MTSSVILFSAVSECASEFNMWTHTIKMVELKMHNQHITLLVSKNNKNTTETSSKFCRVYNLGDISDCQIWNCLSLFRSSFQSFDIERLTQIRMPIRRRSRRLWRISEMISTQKYSRPTKCPQQIPINNQSTLEKAFLRIFSKRIRMIAYSLR